MCNNTVDPDGDVILKLEYPNDPFAPEGGGVSTRTQKPNSNALAKGDSSTKTTPVPPVFLFRGYADIRNATAHGEQSSSQDMAEPEEADTTESVTFRVSSRHLILASPVFKSALTRGWKESFKIKGEFQITSQGWDATALGIFLNAIHCQYKQVPRLLELEMLAKVAVIVDYYVANEAIEILGPIWIDGLRSSLPTTTCPNRTIALWICISFIFGDESAFRAVTEVAIHHGRSNMTDFGLPIPGWVIRLINQQRKLQVSRVFNGLVELQRDLLADRKGCGFECRTMQLGALTRLLSHTSLLNYSLEKEYQALSVSQLLQELGRAVCPTWYGMFVQAEKKPDIYGSSGYSGFVPTSRVIQEQIPHKPHECAPPGNAFHAAIQSITQEVKLGCFGLSIIKSQQVETLDVVL